MKPPPDLIEGEEEYEVEAIMNHKKWGRGYQYLIKWKGKDTPLVTTHGNHRTTLKMLEKS